MFVGRLIGSFVLNHLRANGVLLIAAMCLIGISLVSTGMLAVWLMVAVGLCNSIMFAVIFSLTVNGLGSSTAYISGYLSSAIVGGAIVFYSQGVLIDN